MTTKELKIEIEKTIDKLPESALIDILDYLKELEKLSKEDILLYNNLGRIIREDKTLLAKLAE